MWGDTGCDMLVPVNTATCKNTHTHTCVGALLVGATCPPNAISVPFGGRTFCKFCSVGEFKRASTATCEPCPRGTYQDLEGSTSCKPCPAGSTCYPGASYFVR
jgi:hypothetical protein